MPTMVAVDLGAQSGRVAVGHFDGRRLTVDEIHRFPNVPVRTQGRLQWDILRLYQEVLLGLRAAAAEGRQIDSVGADSWAVDFGLLDRKGRLLQNPVHYRDARRSSAVDRVYGHVPPRELYERTGIQLLPINTVFELAGMVAERDPVLDVAETLLLIPDLIHHWLSGSRTSEFTNATTTQCFDPWTRRWATDLLDRLEIPTNLLPEVVSPGTPLGPLAADVAIDTGLTGATVVAPATHDTAAAVAAVPFRRHDSAYISAGTWSLVGVEVKEPVVDDNTFGANLTNEGGVAATFRLLRNVTGLWLVHECCRAWAHEGRDYAYDELVSLAGEEPALRSLIDPDDPVFSGPGNMPHRVREFCAASGQPEPATPAAITRCILESLALKHAHVVELLRDAAGATPQEVHIVGGGARNELLCRWTADACGLPVLAGPAEATEIGNLVVQALALGELGSLHEAREVVAASFAPAVYEPREGRTWDDARARFSELASRAPSREEIGA